MTLTFVGQYPELVGRRFAWVGSGKGPKSYNSTTGDALALPGFQYYIDAINNAQSVSGTYNVIARPSGTGERQTWAMFWYKVSDGSAASGDLSAESVQLNGFGGTY